MRATLKAVVISIGLILFLPQKARAYTECSAHVNQIYITDSGTLYVFFDTGAYGSMANNDPNYNGSLALMTTALTTGKMVMFRTNNASCASQGGAAIPLTGTSIVNHS